VPDVQKNKLLYQQIKEAWRKKTGDEEILPLVQKTYGS